MQQKIENLEAIVIMKNEYEKELSEWEEGFVVGVGGKSVLGRVE